MATTEQPSAEVRQDFEVEHERTLKILTPGDRKFFIDCLEIGRGGLESWDAQVLILGLEQHRRDYEKGIPRDRALIAAKLISAGEGQGRPEDRDKIVTKLESYYGGEDDLEAIRFEGFEKSFGAYSFSDPDAVIANLAGGVDKAVDEFLAERPVTASSRLPKVTDLPEINKAYEGEFKPKEREAVEYLAEALVTYEQDGQKPELREKMAIVSQLSVMKFAFDLTGELEPPLAAYLNELNLAGRPVSENLIKKIGAVLKAHPIRSSTKGEERVNQARRNLELSNNVLIPVLIGQMVETEKKIEFEGQLKNLRFSVKRPAFLHEPVEIDPQAVALIKEAGELGIALPIEPMTIYPDGDKVGQIVINLNQATAGMEITALKGKVKRSLIALPDNDGIDLPDGYAVKPMGELDSGIYFNDQLIASLQANGDLIELHWEKDVALSEALAATATLGRALSEEFPQLILKLAEPEPAEPAGTVPAGEKTELPTEETSGSDLEVPESAPIETSSQAPEMPDWLRALQAVPSIPAEPAAEEEAEGVGEEMEVAAPAPLETSAPVEPEKPKPIQVSSTRPIEAVAKTIESQGVADFEFDARSTKTLFYETLVNVVRGISVPKLTIDDVGISEFTISGGQIRLSVTVNGSYKQVFSVPVSASMSVWLNSRLELDGIPDINLPKLAPGEAKGLIVNQLRQIRLELSRTIVNGLKANRISDGSVDSLGVRNNNLLATIRGKAINK